MTDTHRHWGNLKLRQSHTNTVTVCLFFVEGGWGVKLQWERRADDVSKWRRKVGDEERGGRHQKPGPQRPWNGKPDYLFDVFVYTLIISAGYYLINLSKGTSTTDGKWLRKMGFKKKSKYYFNVFYVYGVK